MIAPHHAIVLFAATAAVSFGLGIRWQRGADAIEHLATVSRAAKQSAALSADLEDKLAESRASQRVISRSVSHETQKPEYRCRISPGGVRLRSDAIRAAR